MRRDVPLHSSEHTRDFDKPVTVRFLERFDPDLDLIRNRRTGMFEVHRRVKRATHYWVEGLGNLVFLDTMLVYLFDWTLGLLGSDDPSILRAYLEAGDIRRNPELASTERAAYLTAKQRQQMAEKSTAEWRYVHRENRRLLEKAWEPLVNSPSFVR